MMDILFIAAGLALLFFGGEGLVKGSVSLARRLGLSDLLVSAVVVGFGTSMPEMTVSVGAALKDAPEIALGNVVGSNIANVLLILSICALIYPMRASDPAIMRDSLMVLFTSLILCTITMTMGVLNFVTGLCLFILLIAYIGWIYGQDRKRSKLEKQEIQQHVIADTEGETDLKLGIALLYSLAGLAMLVGGATLLVDGATSIARQIGISEAVIGLTLVAVGTSLPELATGFVAAMRKHGDVIIGNILGSNIFNILSILGVTGMIASIPLTGQIADFDIWVMLAVAIALIPILWSGKQVTRIEGALMLAAYIGYVAWLYMGMQSA